MADTQRAKDDFVNAATGLFDDNTSGDISPQDLRDLTESLHFSFGSLYFSSSAETTISGAGTYVKAAGTTTEVSTHRFTHTTGRLTYDGAADVHVHIAASVSMTCAGNNKVLGIGIAKNGTVLEHSKLQRFVGTGTDVGSTALHADATLSTNDYIEIYITNVTDTTNATITLGYLFVMGMFK